MEFRNELGFLFPSRYHSSDFDAPSSDAEAKAQSRTLSCSIAATVSDDNMGSSQSSHKQIEERRSDGPNLLDIPLEIRLHIYHYVLMSHPIHHAHLAPITPQPDFSGLNTAEFYTNMGRSDGKSSTSREIITRSLINQRKSLSDPNTAMDSQDPCEVQLSYMSTLLASSPQPASRIQGKIPTALLTSCKQIFAEASHLPWHYNTFSFINWFWSGVYAARQFSSNLPAWQRHSMRNVVVEVLGKDLWVGGMERRSAIINERDAVDAKRETGVRSTDTTNGKQGRGVGEWRELCCLWSGVQNLKLTIRGGLFVDAVLAAAHTASNDSPEQNQGKVSILDTKCEWVTHGLKTLNSLRTLELEIEDPDVASGQKMSFCAALEQYLNTTDRKRSRIDSWSGDVRVIFIEKTKIVQDDSSKIDKFVYYGGEPGDESVWAGEL